jgi:hypothetical protein
LAKHPHFTNYGDFQLVQTWFRQVAIPRAEPWHNGFRFQQLPELEKVDCDEKSLLLSGNSLATICA